MLLKFEKIPWNIFKGRAQSQPKSLINAVYEVFEERNRFVNHTPDSIQIFSFRRRSCLAFCSSSLNHCAFGRIVTTFVFSGVCLSREKHGGTCHKRLDILRLQNGKFDFACQYLGKTHKIQCLSFSCR